MVGDRRQRLDIDLDQPERVLGDCRRVGERERDRLADVTHFAFRDHRLRERLEFRQRLQPHGHARHIVAHIRGRDHAMHARQCTRARNLDRTDTTVGDGAAQDRRIQHIAAREIVDIFPASAQKTQILEPFDRAANERVDGSHLRSPPRSLARAFGLYAARASSTASTMGI